MAKVELQHFLISKYERHLIIRKQDVQATPSLGVPKRSLKLVDIHFDITHVRDFLRCLSSSRGFTGSVQQPPDDRDELQQLLLVAEEFVGHGPVVLARRDHCVFDG